MMRGLFVKNKLLVVLWLVVFLLIAAELKSIIVCYYMIDNAANVLGIKNYNINMFSVRHTLVMLENNLVEQSGNDTHNQLYLNNIKSIKGFEEDTVKEALQILIDSENYISRYDVEAEMRKGCDYSYYMELYPDENVWLEDLKSKKIQYGTIDRGRSLSGIFLKVCGDKKINQENHIKIWDYLARISVHPDNINVIDENKEMLVDPVLLLETHMMQCGQIARLFCDIMSTGGAETRLVQLGGHVVAEVFYDGKYHFFDADLFNDGSFFCKNGEIPSVNQLSLKPELLDVTYSSCFEMYSSWRGRKTDNSVYITPSYYYFSPEAYSKVSPCYYYKTASIEQRFNKYYGWNHLETKKAEYNLWAHKRLLFPIPYIEKVATYGGYVDIQWRAVREPEKLEEYIITVSRKSRNWDYGCYLAEEDATPFLTGNFYRPEMWEDMGKKPYSEVCLVKSAEPKINLSLPRGEYYISICAVSKDIVNRERLIWSNEIHINTAT